MVDSSASCDCGKVGIVSMLTARGSEGLKVPIYLAGVVTLLEGNAVAHRPWRMRWQCGGQMVVESRRTIV